MGRPRQPHNEAWARYEAGSSPKRIMLVIRTETGGLIKTPFATRHARAATASMLEAVDKAEADKIASRGDPTQTAKRPKRDGTRGITRERKVRPPSRLKVVECAAIAVDAALSNLITDPARADALEAAIGSELMASIRELQNALGKKAKPKG